MTEPEKPTKRRSNQEISAENHQKLQDWLDAATVIPHRTVNGVPEANLSAICLAAEVDRQVIYTSERAKAMIAAAVGRVGLGMPEQKRGPGGDQVPAWATQRIKDLEEQLAVAKAETHALRARLRRYEHLEQHMTATGLLAR